MYNTFQKLIPKPQSLMKSDLQNLENEQLDFLNFLDEIIENSTSF